MKQRILNLLIALDQLAWVLITLGKGWPDETISAACWRMEQQGKRAGKIFRPLIDLVFEKLFNDHCHCAMAFVSEKYGHQLPKAYQ